VRYYRQPPVYFHGWRHDAPPRWGKHWGHDWEQRRRGWNNWKRGSAPGPAPLPLYQRHYAGARYPGSVEEQQRLRSRNYGYLPREKVVRRHYKQQGELRALTPSQRERRQGSPVMKPRQQDSQRPAPQYRGDENIRRSVPPQQRTQSGKDQRQQPGSIQHQQQGPGPQGHEQRSPDRGVSQEPKQGHGQGEKKGDERGREHGK